MLRALLVVGAAAVADSVRVCVGEVCDYTCDAPTCTMQCANETAAPGVSCDARVASGACTSVYDEGIGCTTDCASVVFEGVCSNGTEYTPLCGMDCGDPVTVESSCCIETEECTD